jgi:hypothetical protein
MPAKETDEIRGSGVVLGAAEEEQEEEEELPDVDDEPELACWGGVQQADYGDDSQSEGEQGSEAHMGLHEGDGATAPVDVAGAEGLAAAGNTPGATQQQAEDEFDFG